MGPSQNGFFLPRFAQAGPMFLSLCDSGCPVFNNSSSIGAVFDQSVDQHVP